MNIFVVHCLIYILWLFPSNYFQSVHCYSLFFKWVGKIRCFIVIYTSLAMLSNFSCTDMCLYLNVCPCLHVCTCVCEHVSLWLIVSVRSPIYIVNIFLTEVHSSCLMRPAVSVRELYFCLLNIKWFGIKRKLILCHTTCKYVSELLICPLIWLIFSWY